MNQQQRRYTQKRMEETFNNVDQKLQNKHRTDAVRLTREEMYQQIKEGVATLKPKSQVVNRTWGAPTVKCFFNFTGEKE